MLSSNEPENYYGLLGTTASIRVPISSKLYAKKKSKSNKNSNITINETEVKNLLDSIFLKKNKFHTAEELFGTKFTIGTYVDTPILNFKNDSDLFKKEMSKDDIDMWSKKYSSYIGGNEVNHNEYFFPYDVDDKYIGVLYDIFSLLRIRRKQLFTKDLSERIYNIFLPLGKIVNNSDTQSIFLVIPFITLHRKPKTIQFRRTVSINLILIPINNDNNKRPFPDNEIFTTFWQYGNETKFHFGDADDPLGKFLDKSTNEFKIVDLMNQISIHVLHLIDGNSISYGKIIKHQIDHSYQKICSCVTNQSDEVRQNILKFDNTSKDFNITEKLKKLIHPYHYFVDGNKDGIFQATFDIKELNVNDKYSFDSHTLLFYNPRDSYLFEQHFKYLEKFPGLSIKWMFIMHMYMLMEISLFKIMLDSFYHETESGVSSKHVTNVELDLIKDLDEFYDLDLSFSSYKHSYVKIRDITGLDHNYKLVKDKINALTNYFVVSQQKRTNLAVTLLTIFSVAAIFMSVESITLTSWRFGADIGFFAMMCIVIILIFNWQGRAKNR